MSPDRTEEGRRVEPGGPGFPKTKPEVIAYVVFRVANLIEDVTRSTPQLTRSIILLWSMIIPVFVIMWAGYQAGTHFDGNTWYAQWDTWATVGTSGTLTIAARALRRRQHRRRARGLRRRRAGRLSGRPPAAPAPQHPTMATMAQDRIGKVRGEEADAEGHHDEEGRSRRGAGATRSRAGKPPASERH